MISLQRLRESHATILELTSQVQELQERQNFLNGSREFHDTESISSGKLSHVPSQPAVVPSPRSVLSRDQSLQLDTWNLSGRQGNVYSSQIPFREFFTLRIKVSQVESSCRGGQGDLSRQVKKNWKHSSNADVCRKAVNDGFFPSNGNSTEFYGLSAETANLGASFLNNPTPSTISFWKTRFKTQVSSCSDVHSEALVWIKEVEMVDLWTI